MSGALEDIRVLELSRYIAAPVAGKLLGEFGADVVKIETPGTGDPMRHWQSGDRAHSPQFAVYNRTKRGITLDLKHPKGVDVFLRLADRADVVVENFRPGVMDRLGVGWGVLSERNPRLIYCAITGFGPTGPYVDRPAYDTVISAMGGLFSQLIDLGRPQPVGPAFSDLLAGLTAVHGILAAIHARQRSGHGQMVDASMLRAVVGLLAEPGSVFLDQGQETVSNTRQRRAQAYGLVASDGLPFVVHMSVPEKFWLAVTEVFDLVELREDPRFVDRMARHDNYAALDQILKRAALTRTRAAWFDVLEQADVPHGPINGFAEVFDDPQVAELELIQTIEMPSGERPLTQVGPSLRLSETGLRVEPPAPDLGQHTEEVLIEFGFSPAEIESLRREGVI
ncbi:MAG: CoA transferase [Acidimicrobiia bacterium]|nr:CoA transferase [Acidimicrobiia bacterium]